MAHTILVLSILGSYVVSLTATIPPDYALQDVDYLCNGLLKSNTTVVLDGGEHRISTNCTISIIDNVTIMGSSINSTTIHCEEGSGLQFVSVQQLTLERVTFINCGIILTNAENTLIKTCIFQDSILGSAVTLDGPKGYVRITNCIFQNNSATFRGALWLDGSTSNVSIRNCTFQNNSAAFDGGAMYISVADLVIIDKSTFINNTAVRGAAVYASNLNDDNSIYQQGNLTLQEVIVENNHCFCNEYPTVRGGAIYFSVLTVDIIGDTITGSQFLSNSPLGAITGEIGFLQLHGNVLFKDNIGENGGAISLSNNVPLHFDNSCTVEFSRNVATGYGGAIYNEGGLLPKERGFSYCTIIFNADSFGNVSSSITFTDNHAQQGGHAVYATPIYKCICIQTNFLSSPCENVSSYFTINPLPQDLNDTQVLSFPTYVQLCNCSDPELCNVTGQYERKVTTYPGGTVRLNVTPVDDGNHLSPSVVYASIGTNGDTTTTITLGPGQEAQWIAAAAEGVYIWGGSGGQRDNYIHTRVHNMGYAIKLKTVEMCQSSEFADHFVI